MYKQFKKLNNFSMPKRHTDLISEFLSDYFFFKQYEARTNENKKTIRSLFLKYGSKVFNVRFQDELKKVSLKTVTRTQDIDKDRLKKLYPVVYKDCLKSTSYTKITVK